MTSSIQDHEKLFDEICNQLNEFVPAPNSSAEVMEKSMDDLQTVEQPRFNMMQDQMKKFHTELKDTQEELKEKIKAMGNMTYSPESVDGQVRQLAEQLAAERTHNTKLSADLAKSLELCLQLQLEIQGLKARTMQIQTEEKKYSQALLDKTKLLQRDLELNQALKDETAMELAKAKNAFLKEQDLWTQQRDRFEQEIMGLKQQNAEHQNAIETLNQTVVSKDQEIQRLNSEINQIQQSFKDVENSAEQQQDVLKNLMDVAESKIVEMKMLLDKKSVEAQDYYSHLQQALTQTAVLKQENAALKDYINKLNMYHQQTQQMMAQQSQQGMGPTGNA